MKLFKRIIGVLMLINTLPVFLAFFFLYTEGATWVESYLTGFLAQFIVLSILGIVRFSVYLIEGE